MDKFYGFAAQPNEHGVLGVWPAFVEDSKIYCTDPAGFGGTHELRAGGVFFRSEDNNPYCKSACNKCSMFVDSENKKN